MNKTLTKLCICGVTAAISACGGGSSGGGGGSSSSGVTSTSTSGSVVSLDGQTTDRSNLMVIIPSTGQTVVTDINGDFDLGRLPATTTTMTFVPPSGNGSSDAIVDLRGGGDAILRVSMNGDTIERLSVERSCGQNGEENTLLFALDSLVAGRTATVEIRRGGRSDPKFKVKGRGFPNGQQVRVTLTDPAGGQTETVGTRQAGLDGEFELEIEGLRNLPFALNDLGELEDYRVRVEETSSGNVVLVGTVPAAGFVPDCGGGNGNNDSNENGYGETRLASHSGVTGEAKFELESRTDDGRQELKLQVERSNAGNSLEFWLEDPVSPGVVRYIGDLWPDDPDELEYKIETEDGQVLPYGVSNVSELSGLVVEVRDRTGFTVFSGISPSLRTF